METQWMTVTPEMAKHRLEKQNTRNRNLSRIKVDQYARDMKNGDWSKTHQGIAFYDDDVLADGQHRLAAIIQSGVPYLWMSVTFGLKRESGAGIDVHRARRMDDQIKIAEMADWISKDELAIVKLLRRCGSSETGWKSAVGTISAHEAVAYCNAHKESISGVTSKIGKRQRNLSISPVFAAAACAYKHVGDDVIARFMKVLSSGVMESIEDVAAIRLRERLIADARKFAASDAGRAELVRIVMRAIKAFNDGEKLSKLQTPSNYIYPILKSPL